MVSRWLSRWPVLVWILMVGITWLSYNAGGRFRPLNGQIEVVKEDASCLETAAVKEIHVAIGDYVQPGQLLVTMDTTMIDEEIEALKQELLMEAFDRENDFMRAEQRTREALNEVQLDQARREAEYQALTARYSNLESLLAQGLITDNEYSDITIELADLKARLNYYPEMIKQHKQDLDRIMELKQQMDSVGSSIGSLNEQDRRLMQLYKEREAYQIRAASQGTVVDIEFQQGEIAGQGDSIIEIVKDIPPKVETFVPEDFSYDIEIGQEYIITPITQPKKIFKAKIASITPNFVGEVDQGNLMARHVIRGRRIVLEPVEPCQILPGESVMIERLSPSMF